LLQTSENKTLKYKDFLRWEEIQAILEDGSCTKDEIENIWRQRTLGKDGADFQDFVDMNYDIDDMFEYVDDEGNEEGEDFNEETGIVSSSDEIEDPWDPSFDPVEAYEPESLDYIRAFFEKNANPQGRLSYKSFAAWEDVLDMIRDGEVDQSCLKDVWREAVMMPGSKSKDSKLGMTTTATDLEETIDLDTFLRMYIRLSVVLDEIEEALESLSDADVEKYYRKEFEILTGGDRLLGYDSLMEWPDMADIFSSGSLDKEQVLKIWNALPKEPLPAKKANKGFGSKDGITVEAFLALNQEIEDKLYANEQ